jgi:hypoxia up-regulated 1
LESSTAETAEAAETTETTESVEPSSTAVADDDFAGLEDENTTTSSSTSIITPKPTPQPPTYTPEDLEPVRELINSISEWLAAKLEEQDALPETAEPVLLVRDLAAKAAEVNKAGVDLIVKSIKPPPVQSSSSSKSKTSKSKKPKKTKAAKKGGKGKKSEDDFPDIPGMPEGMKMFKMGEDGEMTDEEFLAAVAAKSKEGGDAEHKKDEL